MFFFFDEFRPLSYPKAHKEPPGEPHELGAEGKSLKIVSEFSEREYIILKCDQ